MNRSPCKDCMDRHTLCHGSCQRYIDYKARLDNIRAARFKAYKSQDDYLSCMYAIKKKAKGL